MYKEAKISSVMSLFPLPQYVVVLQDIEATKLVPIWIGPSEGNAIALEMQGEKFPRPLTHDLMVNLLGVLGAKIQKVVVCDLKDNSYYALIFLERDGQVISIDARPSDSLALAVRVKCPIFIDEKVLEKCPALEGPITENEISRFKDQLKTMSPEEFFKRLQEAPPSPDPLMPGDTPDDESEEDDNEEEPR